MGAAVGRRMAELVQMVCFVVEVLVLGCRLCLAMVLVVVYKTTTDCSLYLVLDLLWFLS